MLRLSEKKFKIKDLRTFKDANGKVREKRSDGNFQQRYQNYMKILNGTEMKGKHSNGDTERLQWAYQWTQFRREKHTSACRDINRNKPNRSTKKIIDKRASKNYGTTSNSLICS